MATACETFYDQDYLDLNPDVASNGSYGKNPRKHWADHGSKEIKNGIYNRQFNHQCKTPVRVAPTVFLAGSSTPVIVDPEEPEVPATAKEVEKVVIYYKDGTTQEVEVKTKINLFF